MSATNLEAIMIVFHIGTSKKFKGIEVMDFFTEARDCIFKILLRKILSDSKDLVSLAIAGSESTENDLADEGEYQNIDVICPFVISNWDVVERVLSIEPSEIYVNWLDAVIVGIQCLRDKIEECEQLKKLKNKISKKKLVLLSSFIDDVADDQVDSVVDGLKDLGIELVVIGPDILKTDSDVCDPDIESSLEKHLTKSQQLILKICDEISDQGTLCICSEALKQLEFFTSKKSRRMPWNVNMSVGSDISIPIMGYKVLVNQLLVKWEKSTVDHEPVRIDYSYFSGENEVDRADIISGYLFGSSIVPFSDHDEVASKYDSGERGLSVLFTVRYDEVKMHLFMGQSTYYIMGRKDNQEAQKAISAFAEALSQSKFVAIARRVYSTGGTVTIGALYPKVDVSPSVLIYVELPFRHEINKLWFPSLSNVSVSDEQLNAVNKLMDSMDLSSFDEDDDPYKPEKLHDPYEQYLLHCISVKGLQGTRKYSESEAFKVPDFIKNLLLPLPEVVEKSASALEEIKKEFPLEIIERKSTVKSENNEINIKKEEQNENGEAEENDSCLENGNVTDFLGSSVVMVGTLNPESDFTVLLRKGETFERVCEQMQKVIVDLLRRVDNLEMMKKPLSCLNLMRISCIENKKSDVYNDWMKKLKEVVLDIRQLDFWNRITEDNLGLITTEEDCSSCILIENAIDFLKYDLDDAPKDEEMDIAAMLDDI